MMRTATFAAAVLFAAVLFAAPAPAAAQEVYSAPCGEESVWRFYASSRTAPGVERYDFNVQSDHPDDRVGLHVAQYVGQPMAWATMLATPEDNPRPFAAGSAWLRTARWTDVTIRCDGTGVVSLSVTRRTEVDLAHSDPGWRDRQADLGSGLNTMSCRPHDYAAWPWRAWSFVVTDTEQYGFEARVRNPRPWLSSAGAASLPGTEFNILGGYESRSFPGRKGVSDLVVTSRRPEYLSLSGSLGLRPDADGGPRVYIVHAECVVKDSRGRYNLEGEDELTLRVTRRSLISLRRLQ